MQGIKIGLKIMQRRKELGLTQEELALKMGYKSKSTINKIEKCINDVSQSNVVKFAKALQTTEAYLMGWTDNPNFNFPFFTKEDMERFASKLPPIHLKEVDGVIIDDDFGEDSEGNQSTIKYEDIDKAFEFYEHYKNAIPQIQEAVRNLLKVDESDS